MSHVTKTITQKSHYVYAVYAPTRTKSKSSTIEFGITCNVMNCFTGYPKDCVVVYLHKVKNSWNVKDKVLASLKEHFEQETINGKNYFSGESMKMINQIDQIITNMHQKVDDDYEPIINSYKNCIEFKISDNDELNEYFDSECGEGCSVFDSFVTLPKIDFVTSNKVLTKSKIQPGVMVRVKTCEQKSQSKQVPKKVHTSIKTAKDSKDTIAIKNQSAILHNVVKKDSLKKLISKTNEKKGVRIIIDQCLDENLCDDENEITKIYHISDIHISRFDDRHREYMIVFERLVSEIKKDTTNAIIVICGDILHEKNTLSPPQILLAKKFFIMLSDVLPCCVIIGNHDISPHGNTIDAITPILKNLTTIYKIHLLLEDKCYYYNNIVFGLTSMFTNIVTPCVDRTKIKIGLYHGIVGTVKIENNFELNKGKFNVGDFKKYYDYVLLGDIHKHSYLDDEKTIAYPGSLLQTRHGEDLDKGVLKWNLTTGKSNLIRIKNDWGFLDVKCNQDGFVDVDFSKFPKNPIVKMEYENITTSQADEYLLVLREKYNAKCSLVRTVSELMDITIGKGKKKKAIKDIKNNNSVVDIVKDFINANYKWSNEDKLAVGKKIEEILKLIDHDYCNSVKKVTIKKLKFGNFFNFGPDNVIDYTKMSGIVGINGKSYIGKSTAAADVLLYSIFGECSRGDKYDTINVTKKSMNTEIEFDVNDDVYSIVRKRDTKGNSEKRVSTEVVTLCKNDEDVSKATIDETNKEIKKLICRYNDFVNVAIMLQQCSLSFVDLSDKDRKGFICGLLKLDVFNDILANARTQICQINYFLSNLRGKSFKKSNKNKTFDKYAVVNVLKDEIEELEKQYEVSQKEYDDLTHKKEKSNKSVIEYNVKNIEFEKVLGNVSNMKKEAKSNCDKLAKSINKLSKYTDDIHVHNKKLEDNESEKIDIDAKITELGDVEKIHKQFQQRNKKGLAKLKLDLENLLSSRTPINEKLQCSEKVAKGRHTKEITKNAKFVESKKEYETQILDLEKSITKTKLFDGINIIKSYTKLQTYRKDSDLLNGERLETDKKLQQLTNDYESLEIHEYDSNCKFCMNYPVTKEKLRCENDIARTKQLLNSMSKRSANLNKNINNYNKYQLMYDEYMKSLTENAENTKNLDFAKNKLVILERDILLSNNKLCELDECIKIMSNNKRIDSECLRVRKEIDIITNKQCNEYLEFTILDVKREEINKSIEVTKTFVDKAMIEVEKLSGVIKGLQNVDAEHKVKASKYNQHKRTHAMFKKRQIEFFNVNNKLIEHTKSHTMLADQLTRKRTDLQTTEEFVEEYSLKEKEKSILELLVQILDKNGLIDSILSATVAPKLESDVNELLNHIGDYKVAITYVKGHFKIDKIKDDYIVNIDTLSGCERFIANICFKLALDQYNNHIKPEFIVIDEVFNCCDEDNIDKLPSLFNYIKTQYKFAIIVSHDDRIKKLYDTNIDIVVNAEGSSIIFG